MVNKEVCNHKIYLLLLSFILSSYIVAPNRKIRNINSFFNILVMSHLMEVNIFSKYQYEWALTLQEIYQLILIFHLLYTWIEWRFKIMIPSRPIKLNKKYFICLIYLPRRGHPMFKIRLIVQRTYLPHICK